MDEEMGEDAAEQIVFEAVIEGVDVTPPPDVKPIDAATRRFLRWLYGY